MLASPVYHDGFEIRQNAKFDFQVWIETQSPTGNVVLPLDGFQARMVVRPNLDSDEVLVDLSTANGRITITEDDHFSLFLTAAETNALTPWDEPGVYDLQLIPSGEEPWYLLYGPMPFSKSSTR